MAMGTNWFESLEDRRLLSVSLMDPSPVAMALSTALIRPLRASTPILTGAPFKGTSDNNPAKTMTMTITSQNSRGALAGTLVFKGNGMVINFTVAGSIVGSSLKLTMTPIGRVPRGSPTSVAFTGTVVTGSRGTLITGHYIDYNGGTVRDSGTSSMSR